MRAASSNARSSSGCTGLVAGAEQPVKGTTTLAHARRAGEGEGQRMRTDYMILPSAAMGSDHASSTRGDFATATPTKVVHTAGLETLVGGLQ
jgi:hypothetical protein